METLLKSGFTSTEVETIVPPDEEKHENLTDPNSSADALNASRNSEEVTLLSELLNNSTTSGSVETDALVTAQSSRSPEIRLPEMYPSSSKVADNAPKNNVPVDSFSVSAHTASYIFFKSADLTVFSHCVTCIGAFDINMTRKTNVTFKLKF